MIFGWVLRSSTASTDAETAHYMYIDIQKGEVTLTSEHPHPNFPHLFAGGDQRKKTRIPPGDFPVWRSLEPDKEVTWVPSFPHLITGGVQ